MAYATLSTKNRNGLNPNFSGLGKYAQLSTRVTAGLHPNLRGLGQIPLTSFEIGPGGSFSITDGQPVGPSFADQVTNWMGSYTGGFPNWALVGGGMLIVFWLTHRGRK